MHDKLLVASFARVKMLVTSGKIDEGVLECLNVLDLLGYKLSREPGTRHVLAALSKAAFTLRGRSDAQLVATFYKGLASCFALIQQKQSESR